MLCYVYQLVTVPSGLIRASSLTTAACWKRGRSELWEWTKTVMLKLAREKRWAQKRQNRSIGLWGYVTSLPFTVVQVQCGGILGNLLAEIDYYTHNFSLVYNHLKKGLLCFHYLRMSILYLQREQVLIHGDHHVALPCSTVAQNGTNTSYFVFLNQSGREAWAR